MDMEDKEVIIKDIQDTTLNMDPEILKQILTHIDQERIDRTIDMIDKIKTLAHEKNFNINQYLEKYGIIKTIPSKEDILKKAQELVPIVEEELKKLFITMTT